MKIRFSNESDIPSIVSMLKISLGESLMPKSESYWRWKHIENPFGISPVLLAEENNKIIGIRAFMCWQWKKGNEIIKAVRAVDTATHPDFQGKGIFKKLTLQLLEDCRTKGIDIVYNTPNQSSKPGYLKMGWKEIGRLPVKVSIKRPLNLAKSKLFKQKGNEFMEFEGNEFTLSKALEINAFFKADPYDCWSTNYSLEYLKWRYIQIPVIKYYGHAVKDALIIFRLKKSNLGSELRICENFGNKKECENLLAEIYGKCDFDFISLNGHSNLKLPGILKSKRSNGPEVTVRSVAMHDLNSFQDFKNWHPTLGDLEVF